MVEEQKTILVWRSAALGDFILSAPAFHELRKNFPFDRIVLLTITAASTVQREKVAKSYVNNNSDIYPWLEMAMPHLIDEVIVIKSLYSLSYLNGVNNHIKKYNIRFTVLMLDPCAPWLGRIKKMLLMMFLAPFAKQIGWKGKGSLNGNRKQLKEKGLLKHHVYGPLQFLSELKLPYPSDDDIKFDLRVSMPNADWADRWLSDNCLASNGYAILGPGAIHEHKMWPIENYCELARYLHERYSMPIIILGTKMDIEKGQAIKGSTSGVVHNLCGLSSISQSAALMKRCRFFIGNDGGAVHLADAVGSKVISIIPGIEYSDSIEPWHNKKNIVRKEVYCSPCYNFMSCSKKSLDCMHLIDVDIVLERVKGLMSD